MNVKIPTSIIDPKKTLKNPLILSFFLVFPNFFMIVCESKKKKGSAMNKFLSILFIGFFSITTAQAATKTSKQNYDKSDKLFELAAKAGHAVAQYYVGMAYEKGLDVAQDYKKAHKWYTRAAKQKFYLAQHKLGEMYYEGWGVKQDYKKSFKWHMLAAKQGHAEAQNKIGYMYNLGQGVQKSDEESNKWYERAASLGHEGALNWFRIKYMIDKQEIDHNQLNTFELFNLHAKFEKGKPKDQVKIGLAHEQVQINPDYKEAVKWYRLAAKKNYAEAQYRLGLMYEKGKGVEKDPIEAFKWFELAANRGSAAAKFKIGNRYYYGIGVEQDYKKALELYEQSAKKQFYLARFKLGEMYHYGIGVEQDYKKASKFYKQAAKKGHPLAKHRLKILQEEKKNSCKNQFKK